MLRRLLGTERLTVGMKPGGNAHGTLTIQLKNT